MTVCGKIEEANRRPSKVRNRRVFVVDGFSWKNRAGKRTSVLPRGCSQWPVVILAHERDGLRQRPAGPGVMRFSCQRSGLLVGFCARIKGVVGFTPPLGP